MNLHVALILFEFVVLIFAFSLHESAHAWMAWKLGDPTAMMLGRVTLNPMKHIDPWGSIAMPLIAMLYHMPLIGWAKPTPVTSRNFKHYKRDDILVTIAGPISNLLAATVSLILLILLKHAIAGGGDAVMAAIGLAIGDPRVTTEGLPQLFPLALLLYFGILINLSLFVFNLIPVPPLDGSHILRHFLPYRVQQVYDRFGFLSLILLLLFGGSLIWAVLGPMLGAFNRVLLGM
ncbi:MAG: site-2 protease family protein [Acidobacteriaceae bacterium]